MPLSSHFPLTSSLQWVSPFFPLPVFAFVWFARICQPWQYSPTCSLLPVMVLAFACLGNVISLQQLICSNSWMEFDCPGEISPKNNCWYSQSSLPMTLLYQLPMTMQTRASLHACEFSTVTCLWRWLPLRILKLQSSPTVLLRTHFTRPIKFHPIM